jgi:cobalt-zinc-cadmium efflux system outer membrane protein
LNIKFPSLRLARDMLWLSAIVRLAAGCQPIQEPPAEQQIAAATGNADAIQFDVVGGQVDVPLDDAALSLPAAVERALRHDPELQAALARVRTALAEANQARLLPNPVLSVAVRFPEAGVGKPVIDAGLAADLLSLVQLPGRVSAADNRLRAASAEAMKTALDLLAEVQERYASVQALDAQAGVLEERHTLIQRLVDQAKARVQAGESGQLDVLTLQAERVGIEADLIQRSTERRQERLKLARLIGHPSSNAAWKISPWQPLPEVLATESQCISIALRSRPEVEAARWELAARGDEVGLAQLAWLDGAQVGVDSERDGPWTVGPSISAPLPFMDWGQQKRAKAQAERIESRHKFTQASRQVVEQVRIAIAERDATNRALAKARDELIPLQDSRREQAEAQYRNGFADITAVLLAEQDAKAARVVLIELQQKATVARIRLERAVGGPTALDAANK